VEIHRLRRDLARVPEERDLPEKATAYFARHATRKDATQDVVDYIEMFFNPERRDAGMQGARYHQL
jgi:hypothetical protein